MIDILEDINAVTGVTGCFVCGTRGELLATSLPTNLDDRAVAVAARSAALAMSGVRRVRRLTVREVSLHYVQGRLIVKNLRHGCLCILCVPRVNVALLNLTVDVAVKKLSTLLTQRAAADKQ